VKKGSRRYKNWKQDGFPLWLQQRMAERGWNALRVSQEIHVVPSLISRWMSGAQQPSPESLRSIARAMQLSELEVLRAAGHLSPDVTNAETDDPRRAELHRKLDVLVLTHERYLTLNALLNMMAETPPAPDRPETRDRWGPSGSGAGGAGAAAPEAAPDPPLAVAGSASAASRPAPDSR
jgi:transcriptional regulator with XRE-family HTH domain